MDISKTICTFFSKHLVPAIFLSFLVIFGLAYVVYSATTIGTNIATTDLEVGGSSTTTGNLFVSGTTTLATTTISGPLTLSGIANFLSNLTVVGNATTTGNQVISGTLNVVGTSTLATTVLSGDIIYGSNNVYDIGNASYQPRDLRLARDAIISGTTTISSDAIIAGKVGIGISSPSESLHIQGSYLGDGNQQGIIVEDTNSSGDPYIRMKSGSLYWDTQVMGSNGGVADASLNFKYGGSSFVALLKSGMVGIGTTTPSSLLHLYSTATTTLTIGSSSASQGSCLKLKDSDGSGYTYCIFNDGVMSCSATSCE